MDQMKCEVAVFPDMQDKMEATPDNSSIEWTMSGDKNKTCDKEEVKVTENKMNTSVVMNILDEALREISDDLVEVPVANSPLSAVAAPPIPMKIQDPLPITPLRVELPLPSSSAATLSSATSVAPANNVTVTTMAAQVLSGSQVTSLAGPVLGTPIMVTGVVIPRAPLPSNLISFVDASGNMQLAAVASPVLNPIHIRPAGVVVNAGNTTSSPIVVNPQPAAPCVAQVPPRPRAVGTIIPVSTLPSVHPPIFKSTVRTIQPNKIIIKNIPPAIKTDKEVAGGGTTSSAQDISSEACHQSTTKSAITTAAESSPRPIVERITIESKPTTTSQAEVAESSARPLINLEAGVKLEGGVKLEETYRPEDEDKVNDVKYKILSVSTSQGVSKAEELARTNLFKLVESESNVVITAPSTAVQDILDQLKQQFPDKKFVINYNSSKTASANLKNLVQGVKDGVAAAERALKRADTETSANPPPPLAKRRKSTAKKAVEATVAKSPVSYRSARLRGEKAPDLFEGARNKPKTEAKPDRSSLAKQAPTGAPRARGRPRKVRLEATEDAAPSQTAAAESLPNTQDAAHFLDEDSTTSSVNSAGPSNGYNAEIRVGEEYQAVLTDLIGTSPPDDYDEKADLIYHPQQGLLESTPPEGSKAANDFPLYDFVEWTCPEKRVFKRYLGAYKTKFFKYLTVLPNKRLLDIIDHYYSTHSPARDYVLPKKSKHYYLVSKSKQMVAPKGIFGIINEKRKVVPNRKFCANSNMVLYEDSLPTRKPRENATRKEKEKPVSNGKPSKVVKFEYVMKPMPNSNNNASNNSSVSSSSSTCTCTSTSSTTTNKTTSNTGDTSQKSKKTIEAVSSVSSVENSENESEVSTEEDAVSYGIKKHRPGTEFSEDLKELISKESLAELATLDEDLDKLKDELNMMKNTYARNKAEAIQMEAEVKKIAKSVDSVNKAIGKARKITDTWSEEDRLLTIQAFKTYGKDFKAVSKLVGTKSEQAIRNFYETNAQRYGLDTPIATRGDESPAVTTPPPASPSKSTAPDSPARGPRPMPSILRRKIAMKPLKS